MAKICAACNKEIGFFGTKIELANGYVCKNCLKKAGIVDFENSYSFTCNTAKELIDKRVPLVKAFKATNKRGGDIQIDELHKTFKAEGEFFEYSNLIDFQFVEDGETLSFQSLLKGAGATAAGGLLLGGVGALAVGAVSVSKLWGGTCNTMEVRIILKNAQVDEVVIPYISEATRKKSDEYKCAKEDAQKCLTCLTKIAEYNRSQEKPEVLKNERIVNEINVSINNQSQDNNLHSGAKTQSSSLDSQIDNLKKLRELVDDGILSEEEFNIKKKEILGLQL